MSDRPATATRSRSFNPYYLVLAFVGLMLAYVLPHNESFLFHPADPVWRHYHPFRWWLLPHGLAGACAIFLGPMQFSEKLRQRHLKLHRVVGRIYVFGALIAAPLGVVIQHFDEAQGDPRSFTIAASVDAFLLMLTTATAFYFVRQGRIQQHRVWMTRSFAVALVFLEVRVVIGLTGWENVPGATETVVWTLVALAIPAADFVMQVQELARSRPKMMRARAASPLAVGQ